MAAIERLVFFGSPQFAVPTLEALVASGYAPLLIVTQPTRPAGRGRQGGGRRLQDPPVLRWARERGVETLQPERVRARDFLDRIRALAPDVAVVVAFGQIFRASLLSMPRLGCVNLHGSLLPRFRGAAPIQAAIAAGDAETGVTTMLMDEGLDTGPMLLSEAVSIGPRDTTPSLAERLASVGGDLMVRTLRGLEEGSLVPRPQPAEGVLAPRLKKSDGRLRLSETAPQIERRFRAYQPWPGLETICRGGALKVMGLRVLDRTASSSAAPGTFLGVLDGALAVVCGAQSVLGLDSVQRPGRKALGPADFLNGERLVEGEGEFTDALGEAE